MELHEINTLLSEKNINSTDKKITKLCLKTDKKHQPRIMEGTDEIIIILSLTDEPECNGSNNKLTNEEIERIYSLLREGKGAHAISKILGVSKKTVYNFKKQMENTTGTTTYKRRKEDIIENDDPFVIEEPSYLKEKNNSILSSSFGDRMKKASLENKLAQPSFI